MIPSLTSPSSSHVFNIHTSIILFTCIHSRFHVLKNLLKQHCAFNLIWFITFSLNIVFLRFIHVAKHKASQFLLTFAQNSILLVVHVQMDITVSNSLLLKAMLFPAHRFTSLFALVRQFLWQVLAHRPGIAKSQGICSHSFKNTGGCSPMALYAGSPTSGVRGLLLSNILFRAQCSEASNY